ncbi:MAG: ABC transporter permease [Halanaerobiaceae bacterium]
MKVIDYIVGNAGQIMNYTVQHFILTGIAIFFAVILWTSVGVIIRGKESLANGVLAVGSMIMCIPSIALYGLLITLPMFGLGRSTAVFALVLYSMLPIVRNVYTGLKNVDNSIKEAARGVGMTDRQILFQIEIPMAMPTILAGVRVTLVMMIGIATLATYIGERNLGRLLHQGIARSRPDMIIVGAIMVTLIAIVIDGLFEIIKKKVVPRGLSQYLEGDHS